jgi:hypothetical protein
MEIHNEDTKRSAAVAEAIVYAVVGYVTPSLTTNA